MNNNRRLWITVNYIIFYYIVVFFFNFCLFFFSHTNDDGSVHCRRYPPVQQPFAECVGCACWWYSARAVSTVAAIDTIAPSAICTRTASSVKANNIIYVYIIIIISVCVNTKCNAYYYDINILSLCVYIKYIILAVHHRHGRQSTFVYLTTYTNLGHCQCKMK